jgi:hypothetical protein
MELEKFPNHNIYVECPGGIHLRNYLVFELPTKTGYLAYMKHPLYKRPDENIHVIFVQAMKFLNMWKSALPSQEPQLSFGGENDWRSDYKFHWAEDGFSKGRNNPVPLAEISCYQYAENNPVYITNLFLFRKCVGCTEKTSVACSFINGITRTIWLLANGVQQFPVYVYNKKEAVLLAKYAGIHPDSYYSLSELNNELERLVGENIY